MSYRPRDVELDPLEGRDFDADNRRDAPLFSSARLRKFVFFIHFFDVLGYWNSISIPLAIHKYY